MKARTYMCQANECFVRITIFLSILILVLACAPAPTVHQQDLDAWVGISVERLDAHKFFMTVPMYRTKTASETEIRNYAYGYDFEECFVGEGATQFGDFVNENAFIKCSSSRIVCNNIFYIKNNLILEYAPTGRCDTDERVQPESHTLNSKSQ